MVSPGQLKIVMGNLQINASLTVVFAIPWPPMHVQFLEMLNIFKLDLFKGLAFAVPCLHSSHFMSLTTFVAAPLVLVAVFALAFGCAAAVICVTQRSSRACKRCAKKCLFGKATLASASSAAIKLALLVILLIYPTICSKVFTTFKCIDVGGGELFMVRLFSRTAPSCSRRAARFSSPLTLTLFCHLFARGHASSDAPFFDLFLLLPHTHTRAFRFRQVADMSVACFKGEWLFWGALSGIAMVVYGALRRAHIIYAHTRSRSVAQYCLTDTRVRSSTRISYVDAQLSAFPACASCCSGSDGNAARCSTRTWTTRSPRVRLRRTLSAHRSTFAIATRTEHSTISTKPSTGGASLSMPFAVVPRTAPS